VQHTGELLDQWYHSNTHLELHDIFCPSVAILRHVTDEATGVRSTSCMGIDDLRCQTPYTFGSRKKHVLAELHDPRYYLSYVQSYEIITDSEGRPWRQSSLRVRAYDPQQGYRLAVAVIFYSERERLQNHVLHTQCSVAGSAADRQRGSVMMASAAAPLPVFMPAHVRGAKRRKQAGGDAAAIVQVARERWGPLQQRGADMATDEKS
jgi:hypothetical protein